MKSEDSVLNHLLPKPRENTYNLRQKNELPMPKCKTNRYKNTLIPFGLYNFQ